MYTYSIMLTCVKILCIFSVKYTQLHTTYDICNLLKKYIKYALMLKTLTHPICVLISEASLDLFFCWHVGGMYC